MKSCSISLIVRGFIHPTPPPPRISYYFQKFLEELKKKKKEKKRCVLDQDLAAKTLQGAVISFFFFSFLVKNPT
jgi:hypothetical protein